MVSPFKFKVSNQESPPFAETNNTPPLHGEESSLMLEQENITDIPNNDTNNSNGQDFMDFLSSNEDSKDPINVGLELLLSPTNIMMKTDVPAQAIPVLSRAIALAKKYKSENLLTYLDNYLKLRVSKDRKGREEILAMILRSNNRNDGFDDDF